MNLLNPKKLLLTKWTAVKPVAKQKHFLVSRVIEPEQLTDPIERVEIEAVFSKAVQEIAWRDLQDDRVWRQGWVWWVGEVSFLTKLEQRPVTGRFMDALNKAPLYLQ